MKAYSKEQNARDDNYKRMGNTILISALNRDQMNNDCHLPLVVSIGDDDDGDDDDAYLSIENKCNRAHTR
jgi:hypothetical protein